MKLYKPSIYIYIYIYIHGYIRETADVLMMRVLSGLPRVYSEASFLKRGSLQSQNSSRSSNCKKVGAKQGPHI
jgi:hypothetical protein